MNNAMKNTLTLGLLLASGFACALADEQSIGESADSLGVGVPVTIQCNIDGARVYLDSDSVGTTPLTLSSVAPGKHALKLVPPDVENWLSEPMVDTLDVSGTAPIAARFSFEQKYLVLSTPSQASVFVGDSLMGTTPLVVKTASPSITLRLPGFEEVTLPTANAKRGILSADLKRIWQTTAEESIFKDSEENGSSLRLYLTGATTILAGATSAYFKVKADNTYSQYVRTGDPNQLAEVNRLDTAAGIALAVTQISLGIFTYFILSE
jgi:hypothetical protein